MKKDICDRLLRLVTSPPARQVGDYEAWIEQTDAIKFLEENAGEDKVVIYASFYSEPSTHFLIHSLLVPQADVNPPDTEDLLRWTFVSGTAWSVETTEFGARIKSSLIHHRNKSLARGEHLLFTRSFEGVRELDYYMEISQKFSHVFGIHRMPERKAWCRLDRNGNIEEVVQIIDIEAKGDDRCGGKIVVFDRELLEVYAALTETVLVRMFDFERYSAGPSSGWRKKEERSNGKGIFYRYGFAPDKDSYTRGAQVVPVAASPEKVLEKINGVIWRNFEDCEKQQEKFIVVCDFENKKTEEVSYEDGMLFEIAFFRPEVLSKYKADREKYSFEEDRVSCRDSWFLEFYDINEAGQAYAFLRHLSYLPHEEQLHWKQFNENPKARVSPHVIKRFVSGEPYSHYSPLRTLKDKLRNLWCEWWKMPSPDAINKARYPVTGSNDEWREEFLNLDQLLVEGFEERWLRCKAKELGRTPEQSFRSLKLLEECLIGLGFEEDYARSIVSPLREVHDLRTKLKGHASGKGAQRLKKEAFAGHGSYLNHYKNLVAECDEAMEILIEAFQGSGMNRGF